MDKDKKIAKLASAALRDGSKMDLLDRLREHLFTGGKKKLNNRDKETLKKLTRIDQLLTTGHSISNCVRLIETEMELSQAQSYKLVREAQQLFGDVRESSKKGKAYILEEMYMRGALKAMQMNDLPSYFHALDSMARLNNLFDSTAVNINMQQLSMPKLVILDSDLETLKKEMEALDITTSDE